ncbi:MAG: tyrosine-type recombinase/integrase [Deltaproteobacteria bacterium]|nr:tyrosine-type recombinase/integrase [Deltaproteobacteria bacterium]
MRGSSRETTVGKNPAVAVDAVPIPRHEVNVLDHEEVPRLIAGVPERWRALFATAVHTGLRKGELFGLRVTDVDLVHGHLRVAHSYDGPTKAARRASSSSPTSCGRSWLANSRRAAASTCSRRSKGRCSSVTTNSSTSCGPRSSARASSKASTTSVVGMAAGTGSAAPTTR